MISQRPHLYHGWPTVARRSSGELLVVCSGGRESHVCPFGWVEMMRSRDGGRSWSWPRILMDSALDDRDAGVLETNRGTLLVTTFTSNAYQRVLEHTLDPNAHPLIGRSVPSESLGQWQAAHGRISDARRRGASGGGCSAPLTAGTPGPRLIGSRSTALTAPSSFRTAGRSTRGSSLDTGTTASVSASPATTASAGAGWQRSRRGPATSASPITNSTGGGSGRDPHRPRPKSQQDP